MKQLLLKVDQVSLDTSYQELGNNDNRRMPRLGGKLSSIWMTS